MSSSNCSFLTCHGKKKSGLGWQWKDCFISHRANWDEKWEIRGCCGGPRPLDVTNVKVDWGNNEIIDNTKCKTSKWITNFKIVEGITVTRRGLKDATIIVYPISMLNVSVWQMQVANWCWRERFCVSLSGFKLSMPHCESISLWVISQCHVIYLSSHPTWYTFPHSSVDKESMCNAGDLGLIPGSGRSPAEGNGNPLQYSCLDNPMNKRSLAGFSSWGCKSWTGLRD